MLNCSSVQIINTEAQKNIPSEVGADVSTGRCRTKGLSVKQWKEIQPPVDCIRMNSPVSLATDTSSFLVTGGCWMGREGGGVVCSKNNRENREKTYFFKKSSRRYLQEAALSLLWILWQFPLVSPLIEEPWTQCQKNAAAWEKVSVLTWNPKQSQQTKKNVWELSFCPSCLRCVQSKLSSWLKTLFPSSTPAWAWETKDGTRGFLFFFLSNLVFSNCSLCVHRCRTSRASTQTPLHVNIMKAVRIAALRLSCRMSLLRVTATPTDSWHTPKGVDLCVFVWTCCWSSKTP